MSQITSATMGGGIIPGDVVETLTGNTGVATASANNINTPGAHNVVTAGAGSTMTISGTNTIVLGDLTEVLAGNPSVTLTSGDLTISGTGAGAAGNLNLPTTSSANVGVVEVNGTRFMHSFGTSNTYLGSAAGSFHATNENVGIGTNALTGINTSGGFTGDENTAVGYNACSSMNIGNNNTAMGQDALTTATTASYNEALGSQAGISLLTGNNNTYIGYGAGNAHTGVETGNIIIRNPGVVGENTTIRIGNTTGILTATGCYIAGIDGVNVGSVAKVVTEASNQLGTATLTAGTGISITPTANTITIASTVTNPAASCAFLYTNNADQNSVTGDGTIYQMLFADSIFDKGSNVSSSTFTAPNTGIYNLGFTIYLGSASSFAGQTNDLCYIQTTAATYRFQQINVSTTAANGNGYAFSGSVLCNMTSGDTAQVFIRFIGGVKDVNVEGSTSQSPSRNPTFFGYQVA